MVGEEGRGRRAGRWRCGVDYPRAWNGEPEPRDRLVGEFVEGGGKAGEERYVFADNAYACN